MTESERSFYARDAPGRRSWRCRAARRRCSLTHLRRGGPRYATRGCAHLRAEARTKSSRGAPRWRTQRSVIDVNYSCRSATTIFAGCSQVLPLALPLRAPVSRPRSCRHLRRSCRRAPRPASAASSRARSSCSCRCLRRSCRPASVPFPRAHAIEASAVSPPWRRGAPTSSRVPAPVTAHRGRFLHPSSFRSLAVHASRAHAIETSPACPQRRCGPRRGPRPTPSQRPTAASLIGRPRCSSCLRCASSPPPPARSFARSR